MANSSVCASTCYEDPRCVAVDFNTKYHLCYAHYRKTYINTNAFCIRFEKFKCSTGKWSDSGKMPPENSFHLICACVRALSCLLAVNVLKLSSTLCLFAHRHLRVYVFVCVYVCVCVCVSLSIHTHVRLYVRKYRLTYVHVHIFTYYFQGCRDKFRKFRYMLPKTFGRAIRGTNVDECKEYCLRHPKCIGIHVKSKPFTCYMKTSPIRTPYQSIPHTTYYMRLRCITPKPLPRKNKLIINTFPRR